MYVTYPVWLWHQQASGVHHQKLMMEFVSTSYGRCCSHPQPRACDYPIRNIRGQHGPSGHHLPKQQQQLFQCRASLHNASGSAAPRRKQSTRPSSKSSATELVALTEPLSTLDVDRDLWEVLDLCSDEELECIYNILHSASPFSPVVKSIVREDEPPLLQLRGRTSIMHKVSDPTEISTQRHSRLLCMLAAQNACFVHSCIFMQWQT